MRHTVIMPFNRPWNWDTLYEHLVDQGIEWRVMCDKSVGGMIALIRKDQPWVKPFIKDVPKDKDGNLLINAGNWRMDRFLDHCCENEPEFFSPNHYVSLMTDDCLWDWGHWPSVRQTIEQTKARVVFGAAMGPGFNIVPAACNLGPNDPPWGNLKDTHNTCRAFVTRSEVLTVRADLLKSIRYGHCWFMDGIIAGRLRQEHAGSVAYHNRSLVYAEALHPEKWGFPHHKLKHEGD